MSVIIAYLNDNAQTPLGRFVVCMLYSQLCNKYSDKSNQCSLGLSLNVVGLERLRCDNQYSVIGDNVYRTSWSAVENFSKSTVAHAKIVHVSTATSFLGVICHPFGKTWYGLPLYKIW